MRRQLCFLAMVLASPAMASGPGESHEAGTSYLENAAFTYDVFELAVPHTDLESCPAEFDPDTVFCRLTLADDKAHVFVFAFEGDQPLMAIKHYELDADFLPF